MITRSVRPLRRIPRQRRQPVALRAERCDGIQRFVHQRLQALVDEALDAIAPFGAQGDWLAALARYSAQRTH